MRSDAEERLEVAKAWADAYAKANHVTDTVSILTEAAWNLIRDCGVTLQLPEGAQVSTFRRPHNIETTWHYRGVGVTVWPWQPGRITLRFDEVTQQVVWEGWWYKSVPPPNLPPIPFKLHPLIPTTVLEHGIRPGVCYSVDGEHEILPRMNTRFGTLEEARALLAMFLGAVAPEVLPTPDHTK